MARSKTTSPRGERPKGAREGNSEFPSVYCARKLCRDIFNPFAGNLVLRPGECRLSHVGLSGSADIFHQQRRLFLPWVHFTHTILCCRLDHRFPLLVTVFAIIGPCAFLFSHTGACRLSLSALSSSRSTQQWPGCVDTGPRGLNKEPFKGTKTSL